MWCNAERGREKPNCSNVFESRIVADAVVLGSPGAEGRRRVASRCHRPGEAWSPLPDPGRPGPTRSLPGRTGTLSKDSSTCILHDNTAGGILMFCKLSTLLSIVFVWQSSAPPPPPTDFLSQGSTKSRVLLSFSIFDCQFQMPIETCEVIRFKNGCCGDCVWYYSSYLSI